MSADFIELLNSNIIVEIFLLAYGAVILNYEIESEIVEILSCSRGLKPPKEQRYEKELSNFEGEISKFNSAEDLVKKFFS